MIGIEKIVSGAQTGVDRAAIDAAMKFGVPYGGWVPKGRLAEDGPVEAKYAELKETGSEDYRVRTERNVMDSDATLIFCIGEISGGTYRTLDFCKIHRRPYSVMTLDRVPEDLMWMPIHETGNMIESLCKKCGKEKIVLNVAGPRESKCPGIYRKVFGIFNCMWNIENTIRRAMERSRS